MNQRGVTLMEILLVLAVISILAVGARLIVAPALQSAKENTLKEDLKVMRKAIDDYYADQKAFPPSLQELVNRKYLREIPVDPLTRSRETWVIGPSSPLAQDVYTVFSGSTEAGGDGRPYRQW